MNGGKKNGGYKWKWQINSHNLPRKIVITKVVSFHGLEIQTVQRTRKVISSRVFEIRLKFNQDLPRKIVIIKVVTFHDLETQTVQRTRKVINSRFLKWDWSSTNV